MSTFFLDKKIKQTLCIKFKKGKHNSFYISPDSAKFKGVKTVKNHDDTAFYVSFGVIENFTHQVKLQAVIILPINNVISMQFSHFCQSNFADSGII